MNIAKSGITGFPGSKLTPLPFKVNVTDVDILLGLAFKPNIPVSFEFLDKLKAEISVSMNLPRLDAKLSTNAAANCGNSTNTTIPSAPYAKKTTELKGNLLALGPLILVEANVSVTVDVGFRLTLPLLRPPFGDFNFNANIFSTVFQLVTACVDAAKSFPPMAASVGGDATATPPRARHGSNSTVHVLSTVVGNATATPPSITFSSNSMRHVISTRLGQAKSTKTHTATMTHSSAAYTNITKRAVTSSHLVVTSHIVKVSSMPASLAQHAVSSVSIHSSALAVSTPLSPASANNTIAPPTSIQPAPPFVLSSAPAFALSSAPPAPTAVMSSGFLGPSNSNIVAAPQQSGPAVFTGAATPGIGVPGVVWREMGCSVVVMWVGVFGGGMVF